MQHELKTDPEAFDAASNNRPACYRKTFEIRRDDRPFQVGDTLLLRRTLHSAAEMQAGKPLVYTGQDERRTITYILRGPAYGLLPGWVVMALS